MNSLFRKINLKNIAGLSLVLFGVASSIVYAVNTPNFTLTINPGTLAIDIVSDRDVDGLQTYSSISSPVFNFNSTSTSMECLTGANAPAMILGDNVVSARGYVSGGYIYVSNPDASSNGFTVSLATTNGINSTFSNGDGTVSMGYNGGDCDFGNIQPSDEIPGHLSYGGRMYVNPSVATIANGKCAEFGCTTTGISLGTSSNFDYGVVDSVTLVQADASADNIADYMINGINVSQTIPAFVPSGEYSLDMTMSVISSGNSEGVVAGPTVTYGGQTVSGGDIYVANGSWDSLVVSSSDPLTVWTSNSSDVNKTMFGNENDSFNRYPVYNGSEVPVIYIFSQPSYAVSENVIYTATSPSGVTNFTVHYGTGILCSDGATWVGNIANCPQDM